MRWPAPPWATTVAVAMLALAASVIATSRACAQQDDHARALALFEESVGHYRAGRFDRAAELLREAYGLEPEPVLLYNLARALEGAGEDEEAVDAYERYLGAEEEPADAASARVRLEVVRRRLEERRALEEQARAAERLGIEVQPTAAPSTRADDPTPWILAGSGALLLAVGAVLGALMLDRSAAAMDAPIHADAARALSDAEGLAIAADAFFGVGALVGAVGLVWELAILAGGEGDATARLTLGPGTVALRGELP
ncbi:MAG: hypothetical protein H6719_34500 [Sandaracinaceae bacterium]|nr:hypothetical protein [Sandaracinaceae bacterium]